MQQHRHQEFNHFINAIELKVPAGKDVHAIIDNYGTHKHPRSGGGSVAIRSGRRTSLQLRPLGSMPLKAASQSSLDSGCGATSSAATSIFTLPSIAT
jgi:hypothetical protein